MGFGGFGRVSSVLHAVFLAFWGCLGYSWAAQTIMCMYTYLRFGHRFGVLNLEQPPCSGLFLSRCCAFGGTYSEYGAFCWVAVKELS